MKIILNGTKIDLKIRGLLIRGSGYVSYVRALCKSKVGRFNITELFM